MEFGKISESKVRGNTVETKEINMLHGRVKMPVRRRYEERVYVNNQQEEIDQYLAFSNELQKDKSMLDAAWRIEPRKAGGYYVVKCYTRLEYS